MDVRVRVRVRVGRNVRRYRVSREVSQEELAHRCALDRTYVSGIKRGVRNPTVMVLERIAAALGIAASVLLEPDDDTAGPAAAARKGSKPHERA